MGRSQRRKGLDAEREFARLIGGRRVPLSGAQEGYPGDVVWRGLRFEVKRRRSGFRQLDRWLANADAVAFREDRGEWKVWIPLTTLLRLLEGRVDGQGDPA